jgi:DNA-directed RNA polymerase subunit RPC12/RpoP
MRRLKLLKQEKNIRLEMSLSGKTYEDTKQIEISYQARYMQDEKKYKCISCSNSYTKSEFGISQVTGKVKPYCQNCSDKIYLKKNKII